MPSIQSCLDFWYTNLDGGGQPAGKAMSKALRAVGLTTSPRAGVTVSIVTEPRDTYYVDVPSLRVDELVAELHKDSRVVKIAVDGVERTAKTVEELEKELAAFKEKVYKVAKKTKANEGWCDDGFNSAMAELGIEVPKTMTRVTLELEVPIDVDPDDFDSVKEWIKRDVLWNEIYDAMKTVEPVKV